jgi:fructoselysine 6-kinase
LASRYPVAVIKRGRMGADAARAAQRWHAAAPAVASVDSTGAGDAFVAAFLIAYAAGESIPACLASGVAKGAEATTALGGRP